MKSNETLEEAELATITNSSKPTQGNRRALIVVSRGWPHVFLGVTLNGCFLSRETPEFAQKS